MTLTQEFRDAILYFMLFDPAAPPPADPRPILPTTFYAPGIGRILARTDWSPDATWFTYSLGWKYIDHQQGDGNQFELYRRGEWLTKARVGYDLDYGISDNHNTLTVENDRPNREDSYTVDPLWQRGSQWFLDPAIDPQILAYSFGQGHIYALGDATGLYNSTYLASTDIAHASRSIVWLKPDHVVIYDRASSMTEGRFKRFWLNLPAEATIAGNRTSMTTAAGQSLVVTTLLPPDAAISAAPAPAETSDEPAEGETMTHRLLVEAPGGPADVRFLHVLQGLDSGVDAGAAELIQVDGETPYVAILINRTVILFPERVGTTPQELAYDAPADTEGHLITGLIPDGDFQAELRTAGDTVRVIVRQGTAHRADAGGVLVLGRLAGPSEGGSATATASVTPATEPNEPDPTATVVARPVTSVTPSAIPDTPVGRQLAWLLEQLNGGAETATAGEITDHFSPDYLALRTPEEMLSAGRDAAIAYGPVIFLGFVEPPTDTEAVALFRSEQEGDLLVIIAVEPAAPYRITAVSIELAPAGTSPVDE